MNYEKLKNITDEALKTGVYKEFYPYFLGGIKSTIRYGEIDGKTSLEYQEIIELAENALEYAKEEKEKQ
ncbi:hypothetical protein ABE096_14160 [Robertmurraya massiliosenegalensis]|uniref:hypothetical protein n=1 Tax=Robertmurraya TaxID=2837507 RepID=UPI0039A41689